MALEVQPPPHAAETTGQTDTATLDGVLRHHLRLEPSPQQPEIQDAPSTSKDNKIIATLQKRKTSNHARSFSQPPMKFGMQGSRPTLTKTTIESDNKKRPGVSKRNAARFESPPPEPPDPNSETKTVTIQRMQNSLQEWDKQLKDIVEKKAKNDTVCSSELASRDQKLQELNTKYSSEHKLRVKTEKQKDKLAVKLRQTEEELTDHIQQVKELQNELGQYQLAYEELDAHKAELEREAALTAEQLETSEGMRRRLNDQVTELQGQLAIEEHRSKICTIL